MSIQTIDKTYVAGTYNRFPVEIVKGSGSIVYDINGKRYIDMGSGIGVTSFGVADKTWQTAVIDQISRVQHMSNLYYTEPCAYLAEMLCTRTGMSKVFFSNSGAEANECAIKVARKFQAEHKGNDCFTIVTLNNSFHGRTLTTLAATGQDHYHELFNPLTPGFVSVDPDKIDSLQDPGKIAAIMIECIQGEGGVVPLKKDVVQHIAEYARKHDILLIVDEVQTGNGRTGKLYSYMHFNISPDVVSTAKGLAGGLPLGATLLSERVKDTLGFGDHGSTFGGNPVSCAAALSILSRIDEPLLESVRAKGTYIISELTNADGVENISGMGLMLGIKCKRNAADIVRDAMDQGVLCLTAKDKVRLLPALNIPMEVLEEAVGILKQCIAS